MASFIEIDCVQRSDAWMAARLGRVTSSRASEMLATNKDGKPAASRKNLLVALVLERLTGRSQEGGYQSAAMLQGTEREAEALRLYEALTGRLVKRTGFLAHVDLMAGASLDGHVGAFERIVEVKAPIPATHYEYLRTGKIPLDYQRQITHQCWISGARSADFVSFGPDFPDSLRLRIVTVHLDTLLIAEHEKAVRAFLAEVDRESDALATMADPAGAFARAVAVA